MKFFNRKLCLLGATLFIIITLISCNNTGPIGPVTPQSSKRTVTVQNPQWASGTGWGASFNPNNYVDIKLRISIKTFNPSNQAIPWGNPVIKTYACDPANSNPYFYNDIDVPQTGMFVIEVETTALECTWINANLSICAYPTNHSTFQYYGGIHTLQNLNNGDYNFYGLYKEYDQCCQ